MRFLVKRFSPVSFYLVPLRPKRLPQRTHYNNCPAVLKHSYFLRFYKHNGRHTNYYEYGIPGNDAVLLTDIDV